MRVVIVTHKVCHNDGQGRVNYEIARAALAENFSVTLVASYVAPELLDDTRVRWVRIHVGKRWPSNLLRYQVFAVKSALWLRAHRADYDVLHVNGFISWMHADVNTAHFVHGGWLASHHYPYRLHRGAWSAYQFAYTRMNVWLERWAYRRSRIIAAVSEKVAAEIRGLGVPDQKIAVIHNGVDVDAFYKAQGDRHAFNLPSDVFLLLFAGDLRTPRKNLEAVLHALIMLPAHVHLAVAGYAGTSPYPDKARALGVAERVHFLGFVKNMPALMRCVDIFVFPSRYEAMSLSLLEALAAGLPVVTAATTGGAEIIAPTCGIVLSDPDDIHALAHAILHCVTDEHARHAMSDAARRLAFSFQWSCMASQYIALYRRMHLNSPS